MAGRKYKRTVVFKTKNDKEMDYSDMRLYHFMLVPYQWESIMTFGKLHKEFAMAFGIGLVSRIVHNEKYDIVYMNFGQKDRPVLVWEYNARKQLVTLSRNKYAIFYGFMRFTFKDSQTGYVRVLYARALQGLYVPTQFDVKKKYPDFKFDEAEQKDTEFAEFLEDLQEIKDE